MYKEIHGEEDYDKKKQVLIAEDPGRFVYSYPAVRTYLKYGSKRRNCVFVPTKLDYDP
jgi:hypothetical protein